MTDRVDAHHGVERAVAERELLASSNHDEISPISKAALLSLRSRARYAFGHDVDANEATTRPLHESQ